MNAKLAKFLQSGTDEEIAEERREARMTRIWSRVFVVIGVVFMIGLCGIGAILQRMQWENRLEVVDSDGPPTAAQRSALQELGYPDSVYRVREAGQYRHGLGTGEKLIICSLPLQDLAELKKEMARKTEWAHAEWEPGFPEGVYWQETIRERAPADLAIPHDADANGFIHLVVLNNSKRQEWSILNLKRGVSYYWSESNH